MDDLDWKRHLSELRHQVLPVFIAVLAVVVLVVALLAPVEKKAGKQDEDSLPMRVSLLSGELGSEFDPAFILARPVEVARAPLFTRVDFPMGSAAGAFSYNAQPFLENRHLGDDLNGIGGWDSDLGDAVYAVADGEVIFAGWPADGWGKVVMVLHRSEEGRIYQSFYGHLKRIDLPLGARVRRGEKIGTVGKGNGQYLAHLHLEIREGAGIAAGPGYGDHKHGRVAGEPWMIEFRGVPVEQLNVAVSGSTPDADEIALGVISRATVRAAKK
ncbi:MAG: M23 family metallopeptidase [Verrucomicrobiota bacterium]